jgi:hypothetical protein
LNLNQPCGEVKVRRKYYEALKKDSEVKLLGAGDESKACGLQVLRMGTKLG